MNIVKEFSAAVHEMQAVTEKVSSLEQEIAERERYKAALDKEIREAQSAVERVTKRSEIAGGDWVRLNVGGTVFKATRDTLTSEPTSFFTGLLSGNFTTDGEDDESGELFIDRSPKHFGLILSHLRSDGDVLHMVQEMSNADKVDLLQEAKFYQVQSLKEMISEMLLQQ